jgi:hypothetical protein
MRLVVEALLAEEHAPVSSNCSMLFMVPRRVLLREGGGGGCRATGSSSASVKQIRGMGPSHAIKWATEIADGHHQGAVVVLPSLPP